jgi:hypothetical protein
MLLIRGEQAEVAEQPARYPEDGLGRQGRQLVAAVRLEEGAKTHALMLKALELTPQRRLVTDGTDDEMGMRKVGRKEMAGRLDGGVTGLHDLLGGGKILANDQVHERHLRHGWTPEVLSPGLEPGRTGV